MYTAHIETERRKQINRALNGISNPPMRRYGFAYVAWMEVGCVGHAPLHPGVSKAGAAQMRDFILSFNLWGDPTA